MTHLIRSMAFLLTCLVVGVAADLFRSAGLVLYAEQYVAILIAVALPLVFLSVPAGRGRTRVGPVPWPDRVLAAIGFAISVYAVIQFPDLSVSAASRSAQGLVVAVLFLVLFLEGLRRTAGPALAIITAAFFVAALVGASLPGEFAARSIPLERLAWFSIWDSSAAFGLPLKIISSVVVVFVLFGQVLMKSGGSEFFTKISTALMGHRRGGSAKIAIVGSSLFGMISGSAVANVLTVGVVTIPMMKRAGFKSHEAAAIEASASTGGQLTPPVMGAAAFIMAEFLQVPYLDVALAAAIPAALFYVALFVQVDLKANKLKMPVTPRVDGQAMRGALAAGWMFPVPFAVLIWLLFVRGAQPEVAGLAATAVALVLAILVPFEGRRVGLRDIRDMAIDTGLSVLDLFMIGAAAGIIIGTLNYSGIGFSLTLLMLKTAGNSLFLLLVIAGVASIVLGMGMPTVGVYILLATLIAPALIEMGIQPMAAHMFIMYYGCLSMVTPPVAIAAFAAANIAEANPMRTGFEAMRFGWTVFLLPFLFVFSGTLLMQGAPIAIAIDVAAAVAGVWFLSAAFVGYGLVPLRFLDALLHALAGLLLILPVNVWAGAHWFNLAGLSLATVLILRSRAARARAGLEIPSP
ncbi:MAG: TRAP transporter fused permease subunit [Bryobacteraceae bacterium]|nr:TRAP transporter fused permease subunit [Bryobacteraceae bacterium]